MAGLRVNRVKARLKEGKTATVVGGLNSPEVIDFMGPMGFEGIWIETEHGAITWEQVANMTRSCDLWGMTSIARVNSNTPWLIGRTLDVGVMGVVVPHVNSRENAQAAVEGALYGPQGHRGMWSSRQSYGVQDYHRVANEQTMVIALLEERRAMDNLEEILSVEEVDVFLIGPGDLSQSMGLTGQANHPDVQAVVDRAIEQIVGAGRTAGAIATQGNVERLYGQGVRFFLANWQEWLSRGASDYLKIVGSLGG